MDDTRPIHSLEDIFNDPDSNELLVQKQPQKKYIEVNPEIEKFKELQQWIEVHDGKEPKKTTDISRLHERGLASYLIGIRKDVDRITLLKPYDKLGLLKEATANLSLKDQVKEEKQNFDSLDDILNNDSVLLNTFSSNTLNSKLFNTSKLNKIKREQKNIPENKSKRKVMKNFNEYKQLFTKVQEELASGKRKLTTYNSNTIELHKFYVLNGQLLYIESTGSEFESKTRSASKTDARVHVIYENGTENYPLRNGLIASLYGSKKRHGYGKAVSEPKGSFSFYADDQITGYIYVLKSLSNNPEVKRIQSEYPLYKVGFTSNTVEKRIANAENESTYLYGPVKVVAEYQVVNLNPEALETALHHALSNYRLDVDIKAPNGHIIHPREWFVVSLETINTLINKIMSNLRINY